MDVLGSDAEIAGGGIRQTQIDSFNGLRIGRAVVLNADADVTALESAGHLDQPHGRSQLDAVIDGIFEQGLQNNAGDGVLQQFIIHEQDVTESVVIAQLLDGDIAFQGFQLCSEGD